MKIRNGFVSNSSSSSFVVEIRDSFAKARDPDVKDLLTRDEISKLRAFGFKYTDICSPIRIENLAYDQWLGAEDKDSTCDYLGYHDSINEDEKIYFLVKNNIPFKGVTHYGHNSVFYERNGKHIIYVRNNGLAVSMYWNSEKKLRGLDNKRTLEDTIPDGYIIRYVPKDIFIKEEEGFMKEWEKDDED